MISRHELAWLSADGWRAARAGASHADDAILERWQRNDWPLVGRRRDTGATPGQACLGLALPPHPVDGHKRRLALRAPFTGIARSTPALPIGAVLSGSPEAWQRGLRDFAEQAAGLTFHVYGSLALQVLTNERYVTPTSDIDLLFYPASHAQLRAGLALLSACAAQLPLDGEIVFPSGDAVAWKEWRAAAASSARVMVKHSTMVRLAPPASLSGTLQ